jgi:hypothetical protein
MGIPMRIVLSLRDRKASHVATFLLREAQKQAEFYEASARLNRQPKGWTAADDAELAGEWRKVVRELEMRLA